MTTSEPSLTPEPDGDDILHGAAVALSTTEGDAVFRDLVRYLARSLSVDVAFIALPTEHGSRRLRMLAVCLDGRLVEDVEYELAGTPCETVIGQTYRYYPSRLWELFPIDEEFQKLGLECYAGYPLNDARGAPLGLIAVVSRKTFPNPVQVESILKIFAARVVTELERRRADRALRQAEASYRAIFNAAEDAIFVHDWDTGAVVDVNPKACELYGYSADELRRISIQDISSGAPPYTAAEAARWIEKAKQEGIVHFEWHRRNRDGSLHWDDVCLKGTIIDGKPHVVAFTREITARKRAEDALRTSEERYRLLFEMESDAILLIDVESLRILDANHAAQKLYGYSRDALLELSATDLSLEPELTARTIRSLAGVGRVSKRLHRKKDGTVFPVEIANNTIELAGRPTILAAIRDVTQRLEQEEALRRSEARLRATVEAAFDCVIGMDIEGRVIEFNVEAQRVFGYTRSAVLGKPLAPLIFPERYREAHTQAILRFDQAGSSSMVGRRTEITAMRSDGTEFPAELAIEVAEAPEGRIFVASLRDVTERRRAEEARNLLEAQLRQAQKMEAIGHLTGGIAHDFNNILTSIMGYVALASDRDAARSDAKLSRYLDQAQNAVGRARDLIRQMLTFSRGQRGEPRPVSLATVLAESSNLLRSTLPSSIELVTHVRGRLPRILLDPVPLEQVLLNLCINARDAMQSNGTIGVTLDHAQGEGIVCASCRQPVCGEYVELAVSDSGPGIAAEIMDRMFEPFFSTKEVGKGSGMGLATVHGIVHEYGGHIGVQTDLGRGTTFRVFFPPLAEAVDADSSPRAPEQAPAGGKNPLCGRVLVVDDEEMVADLMQEMLHGWGLEATVFRSPIEAEAWFVQDPQRVDIVLSDYTMPKINGLQLAQRLTLVRPDIPILLYSGIDIDPAAASRSGVVALIAKPVEPKALFDILRVHLPHSMDVRH